MSNYDATDTDCEYVQCAVCEKTITGGKWFARIKHGEWMVALCCPLCTEAFEAKPRATCGGSKPFSSCGTHNRSRR